MLNSAGHDNLNAQKLYNIKIFSILQAEVNCWHFNINEQEQFHAQLSMIFKKISGPVCIQKHFKAIIFKTNRHQFEAYIQSQTQEI